MKPEVDSAEASLIENAKRSGRLARYLIALLALPLMLYLLPFAVVRLPGFEHWGGCLYGPLLDFGFDSAGENADVVIFGDSSALFGIDPNQISAALGKRVINLPNTLGSLPVTGDMALRHYLRSNQSPRLLVFYFAPWNLNYSHEESSGLIYEGEEMLARHGNFREVLAFARTHPLDPVLFPFKFYSAVPRAVFLGAIGHRASASAIARGMGHVSAAATVPTLSGPCMLPSNLLRETSFTSAQTLATKYRTTETGVLFFLAPIPSCGNASSLVQRSYAALPALPPRQMAPSSFKNDLFFIHLDPSAVPGATETLTEAVRRALGNTAVSADAASDAGIESGSTSSD